MKFDIYLYDQVTVTDQQFSSENCVLVLSCLWHLLLFPYMTARAAIEYEKKGHAANYEQGQAMEKNLILMAREVEKLRAEIANAEKRARAAAAAGNPGTWSY